MREFSFTIILLAVAGFMACAVLALPLYAWPKYNVWRSGVAIKTIENSGKAELARAEQERQILIAQAKAEREAAELRSEAIAIVGRAAQEYPEYRQQEFLGAFAEALKEGQMSQIIYVPTEANIPLMEAGKRPMTPGMEYAQ